MSTIDSIFGQLIGGPYGGRVFDQYDQLNQQAMNQQVQQRSSMADMLGSTGLASYAGNLQSYGNIAYPRRDIREQENDNIEKLRSKFKDSDLFAITLLSASLLIASLYITFGMLGL